MGDFILTLPAIAALRGLQSAHSYRRLEILGYPRIANLAVVTGLADATRSIEAPSLAPFFTRKSPLSPAEARYFDQFDLIVSYIHDPERIFAQRVTSVSHARYISGKHRPDEASRIHATEVFLRPLMELGIHNADPQPRLMFPEASLYAADYAGAEWLAAHPGSGSERKNWPEEKWAALLDTLIQTTSWHLLLVGGEAEGDRISRLAARLPAGRFKVAQNLPLAELAQQLQCCIQYIGHDSGITHLAVAVGLPVVVLWGETVAEIWAPLGPKVALLRNHGGIAAIPVGDVANAVTAVSSK